MYVFACVSVCVPHANLVATEVKRCLIPRTGIIHVCKLPQPCWESDMGPLQKQQVLLIAKPNRSSIWVIGAGWQMFELIRASSIKSFSQKPASWSSGHLVQTVVCAALFVDCFWCVVAAIPGLLIYIAISVVETRGLRCCQWRHRPTITDAGRSLLSSLLLWPVSIFILHKTALVSYSHFLYLAGIYWEWPPALSCDQC